MNNESYLRIRAQLDFRKDWATTLGIVLVDGGLFLVALQLLKIGHWLAFVAAQPLFILVFFHCFGLFHEAVHGNVAGSRRVTAILGNVCGVFCFLPFESWKVAHLQHHRWSGNVEKDPVMRLVKTFNPHNRRQMLFYNLAWRSWLPVMAVLQHAVFWTNTFLQARDASLSPHLKLRILGSALLPPFVYAACHMAWPELFQFKNFALAIVGYLSLTEVVNFPHHLGRERLESGHALPKDQHRFTRSCYYPPWIARGILINFNFHVEHHLYPTLPWPQLARARELVKASLGDAYAESLLSGWIKENRRKDMREVVLPPEKAVSDDASWGRAA